MDDDYADRAGLRSTTFVLALREERKREKKP